MVDSRKIRIAIFISFLLVFVLFCSLKYSMTNHLERLGQDLDG